MLDQSPLAAVLTHAAGQGLPRHGVVFDEHGEAQAGVEDCGDDLAQTMIPFPRLGMGEFGIGLHENLIPVDTAKYETEQPGIFGIGDIITYPGKLKLILQGFSEAAMAAHAIHPRVYPNEALHFEYSTSKGVPG